MHPEFLYGTAWKEEQTEDCVFEALKAGFRGIDTANQRKHYFEEGAGAGLLRAYKELGLKREGLFLQTKFTYRRGQDHRLPYDEKAPLAEQVRQSFESSLRHLHTDYLDSFVLHGPSVDEDVGEADVETWAAMGKLVEAGKVKALGVSNVSLEQLMWFATNGVKPSFVQNRCYAVRRWDRDIRQFCDSAKITYQGFSLLTANAEYLGGHFERVAGEKVPHLRFRHEKLNPVVDEIMRYTGGTLSQVIFRFCQQLGMLPLTGTRTPEHMRLDLEASKLELNEVQLAALENIATD
jgi:diketogulonate reductase-like aldo/keto reductase